MYKDIQKKSKYKILVNGMPVKLRYSVNLILAEYINQVNENYFVEAITAIGYNYDK